MYFSVILLNSARARFVYRSPSAQIARRWISGSESFRFEIRYEIFDLIKGGSKKKSDFFHRLNRCAAWLPAPPGALPRFAKHGCKRHLDRYVKRIHAFRTHVF